jgi:hypothetical protein
MTDIHTETDDEVAACPKGCGQQVVISSGAGPGFTGAPIYWWTLACGHQDVDLDEDTLDAVR